MGNWPVCHKKSPVSQDDDDTAYHPRGLSGGPSDERSRDRGLRISSTTSNVSAFSAASRNQLHWYLHQKPSQARVIVDELVLETLDRIKLLVPEEEEPLAMKRLRALADFENGWLTVVESLISVIPMNDPLSAATIALVLDDCPLPANDTTIKLIDVMALESHVHNKKNMNAGWHRNATMVLGCIAEKLAGPRCIAIFNESTLNYLLSNLALETPPSVILFTLFALEKFAQTSENKITIQKRLQNECAHPLVKLEAWVNDSDFVKQQVGFCAQWCLDNVFIQDGREFSYQSVDMTGINVVLNSNDVSEYLKISPNGLIARSDSSSFESVRSTFQVDEGIWYYEVLLYTAGVMQIGWATKESRFLNHEGNGIGDDSYSLAFDGCRQLVWHGAESKSITCDPWKPGDIVGSLLNVKKREIVFYLNGKALLPAVNDLFKFAKSGFFVAASYMSLQQCEFNFGHKAFKFPPSEANVKSFNDYGKLTQQEKVVLPRPMKMELLRSQCEGDNPCILCFDAQATMSLKPCDHSGFCENCSSKLESCPMCRLQIDRIEEQISNV